MATTDWKTRLYRAYVSTGQGGGDAGAGYGATRPYLERVIARHVPADRAIRILDLGCGAGGMLYWLKRRGYRDLAGVDGSAEMVALAHANGLDEVVLGDIGATLTATSAGSVDVCFVMDVLEHLERQELFDVCDGIFRVLRPGGRIILHVPNAGGLFGAKVRFSDLTHEGAFTSISIRQLLGACGFGEVRCFEDRPVPHGVVSALRAVLWEIGSAPIRLLHAAETGSLECILSQNLLAVATVPSR